MRLSFHAFCVICSSFILFFPLQEGKTVWPDHVLGPLGPQDKRFLMPGRIGPCVNTSRLQQELNAQARVEYTPALDIDYVLPQLPHQRQSDISEQFLTSIDEVSF